MYKIVLNTLLIIVPFIGFAQAKDTIPLSNLIVKKFDVEYEINQVISGMDLTYLTDEYSADSSLFYYNEQLFTGVGLINDSRQYTLINFKNGQLHGLWYDIMISNSNLTHKGKYKKGLKDGEWITGHGNPDEFEIYLSEVYKKGILNGSQKYYGSYYNVFSNNGYYEVEFEKGIEASLPIFRNLDGSNKNKTEVHDDIYHPKLQDYTTESNTFVNGILTKQEILMNDTLFQVNEFSIHNFTYNKFQTNYYSNGKIESKGKLNEYTQKSGEWSFYNNKGILIREEYWELRTDDWDMSYKTKTIDFKEDGSIVTTYH